MSELKPSAELILGNPKLSDFSDEITLSEEGEPITTRYGSFDSYIEFDLAGNFFNEVAGNMAIIARKYKSELESKTENVENNVLLNCLNNIITATENIKINANKGLEISSGDKLTISSSKEIFLNSPSVLIGNSFGIDYNENDPEEKYKEEREEIKSKYDSVLTVNKFNEWYTSNFKPFIKIVKAFMQKYNQHGHSGMCPPPTPISESISDNGISTYDESIKIEDAMMTASTLKTL